MMRAARRFSWRIVAGARQGGVADVVVEVEVLVVDPHRAADSGTQGQPLAVARVVRRPRLAGGEDALLIQTATVRGAQRLGIEESHRADVHVRRVALDLQERAVERREALVVRI